MYYCAHRTQMQTNKECQIQSTFTQGFNRYRFTSVYWLDSCWKDSKRKVWITITEIIQSLKKICQFAKLLTCIEMYIETSLRCRILNNFISLFLFQFFWFAGFFSHLFFVVVAIYEYTRVRFVRSTRLVVVASFSAQFIIVCRGFGRF